MSSYVKEGAETLARTGVYGLEIGEGAVNTVNKAVKTVNNVVNYVLQTY